MRTGILIFILSGACQLMAQTVPEGKEISGTVRIIRAQPQTEVFFKDFKDSVIIPRGPRHNQIFEACERSWKKGTPVKLLIHPVSRQALSVSESATPSSAGTDSAAKSEPASSSSGQGFQAIPEDSAK